MSLHQHSSSSMTGCDKNHRDNDKHESTSKSSSPKLQHLYEHSFHPSSSSAAAVALQQETSQSSSSDEPSLSSKINEQVISLFDGSVAAAYKKKPIIIQACTNCKKAHARCDEQKPCGRCVRLGKPDTCQIPVILKKRGRRKLTLDEKLERKKRRLISIDPIQQGQESETGEQEHEETHDHQLSSDHTPNDMRMMPGVDHPNSNSYNNPNNNNNSSIPYHYHPHHTLPSSTVSPVHLLNNNVSANVMMRNNSTTTAIPNSIVPPPILMNSIVQQQLQQLQQPQSQPLLITNHFHTNSNNNHSSLGHTTPPSSLSHYHPVVNMSIPTTMAQSHPHSQLSQQQQQQQSILSQLQSTSNSATVAQPYSMNNLQQQPQVTMTPSVAAATTNITTNNSNSDSFYEQVKWLMDHQHLVQQKSMVQNNNHLQQPMGTMTNSSIASSCTATATATPTPTNTPLTSNFFNALQQPQQQQQHSSTQPFYYDNNNNNTTNNHLSNMIQQNETPFVTCPYATLTTPSLPAYSSNSPSSNNIQTNIHMNKNETSDNDSNSNMSQASLPLHLNHLMNQQQQGQNHQDNLCSDTESDSAEALFQVLGSHRDNTSPTSATITRTTMTSHYQQTQGSANGRCNNNSSSSSSSISSEDLSFDTITREDSGELFGNQVPNEFSTVEQNLSDKELVKQLMAENRRLSEQLNCLRSVSTVLHDQIVSSCPRNNPESRKSTQFDKERDHFVRDLLVHNSITYDKERSLSKIFRESTDRSGIVLSVASGQIVAVCPVVRRILGYPTQKAEREGFSRYDLRRSGSDDILLQVWRDVLHPTTFQSSLRIFAEAMAKRQGLLQLHAPMILRAGSESDTEPSYTLCKRFDSYIFYCQDMVPQSTPLIFYVLTRIFF